LNDRNSEDYVEVLDLTGDEPKLSKKSDNSSIPELFAKLFNFGSD
jgi:hypothetical protein